MLRALPYKTKQFLFVLLKISLVVGAFYFIYHKLTTNNQLDFDVFSDFLIENKVFSYKNITFLIILSCFNWFFEIIKWRNLVSIFKKIGFKDALQQSLGSLTASLLTPNRIGEYGAKAIFYTSSLRRKIVLLNFLGNSIQMLVTSIFGCIGLYFFLTKYPIEIDYHKTARFAVILIIISGMAFLGWKKKGVTIKGVSIEKVLQFFRNISFKHYVLCLTFSVLRYFIFSFQFYFLLQLFGVEVAYKNAMIVVTTMYLLASIIPSIFIFDVVIKGSVAVYLFSLVGVNELTILSVVTCMWLLNFVLPSIIGSVFVLKFKFSKNVTS
ncbi:lysylphosphatidylglycerol synthase domain-containing protein [Xanthomarina sp. F2636L]|uniref:lysylphosphatidylglycerol synthase domain-containing protein n=1 Tax=Xanthomarina sp. F2636L TaxID=2996018 RepID=UPI00225E3001|nr:lysylphosphatidylglycerol synthase domain-containing protein [Xanthomarina sp. F2636L]MCX7550954.1 lysylphosphatidylglycerol synthase domain-containing protein [Xanthomarina sp. F2636L]